MLAWRPLLSVTTGLEKVRTKQGTKQDRVKKYKLFSNERIY